MMRLKKIITRNTDFVKNTFREGSEDKLDEYFKVWFEMFLKTSNGIYRSYIK